MVRIRNPPKRPLEEGSVPGDLADLLGNFKI